MMTHTAGLLLGGTGALRTTPNVGCLRLEDTDTSDAGRLTLLHQSARGEQPHV